MLGFFIFLTIIFTPLSIYAEAVRGLASFSSIHPGWDLVLLEAL